jgi:hypothetical protein
MGLVQSANMKIWPTAFVVFLLFSQVLSHNNKCEDITCAVDTGIIFTPNNTNCGKKKKIST